MYTLMETIKKIWKKHSVLLLSIGGGILLLVVICGFAFGRHHGEREFGSEMGCGMEK